MCNGDCRRAMYNVCKNGLARLLWRNSVCHTLSLNGSPVTADATLAFCAFFSHQRPGPVFHRRQRGDVEGSGPKAGGAARLCVFALDAGEKVEGGVEHHMPLHLR